MQDYRKVPPGGPPGHQQIVSSSPVTKQCDGKYSVLGDW